MRALAWPWFAALVLGGSVAHVSAQVPARAPVTVAVTLAARYPEAPGMSYISALAWAGSYRLAGFIRDPRRSQKPRSQMAPYVSGELPTIGERPSLTALAGLLAFAEPDADDQAAAIALRGAELMLPVSPDQVVSFATGWTDDMFMATSVWTRVWARTGDARFLEANGRLLIDYIDRLQRDDGLFIHAETAAHAWGRGNGFAAMGMAEALTMYPQAWPERPRVLDAYRRQMLALLPLQAEDGSWRQVLDQPAAYPELTVTALAITAMGRGVRFGWLDEDRFMPAIQRGWAAVLERVGEDGTMRDVCTSTGAQATLEYYLTRPVVNGADDRGGAIVLTAALEMEELRRAAR